MDGKLPRVLSLDQLIGEYELQTGNGAQTYFEVHELRQLVEYYQTESQIDKALQVLNDAIQFFRYEAIFHFKKASIHMELKNFEAAQNAVLEGLAISPNDIALKQLQAELIFNTGDAYEAFLYLSKLLTEAKGIDKIQLLLTKSRLCEKSKDYDGMFSALKRVLSMDSCNLYALQKIWVCVELCRNYSESIQLHKSLIDRDPYNYHAWYNLGHAYACEGEYELSITALEYSFLINEDFEMGYKDCAEMCFQMQKYDQAIRIYLDAISYFGIDHELHLSIGQCYLMQHKVKQAIKHLQKAVVIDPYDDEVHFYLGQAYAMKGEHRHAIRSFRKAISIEDKREEYYSDLAESLTRCEKFSEALHAHQTAVELKTEDPVHWIRYMAFLIHIQAYKRAEIILQEALKFTYAVDFEFAQAALKIHLGVKEEAIVELKRLLEEEGEEGMETFYLCYPQYSRDKEVSALLRYLHVKE